MALTQVSTTHADKVKRTYGYMKPFWLEPSNKDVMGYMLQGVEAGEWIPQGYPVFCEDDAATGQKKATLCKYVAIMEKVSTTIFRIKKNSLVKAGDKLTLVGGTVLSTVKSIEADGQYDKLTLTAANAEADADKSLALATEAGKAAYLPNRVVAEDCNMIEDDKTIVAAHSGIILKNIVKYPAAYINSETFPGSDLLVGCPAISFINQ